ncbi:MAG: heme A synthase [Myxococcales bacterium]|nr:MAG: heme A synthase [Myxococcales bacterium]
MTRSLTRHLALATAFIVWVLITWGGIVHSTGSSLACPDWPLCFSELFPEMKGHVAIEHGHRMLATLVGFLTIVLTVLLWTNRRSAKKKEQTQGFTLHRLGFFALFLVIFQGVLGGLTVIYHLPLLVSSAHLATSLLFLSIILWIAFESKGEQLKDSIKRDLSAPYAWSALAVLLIYLQMIVGALVRHTGSGMACGTDVILCDGQLWPAWAPARLHMLHRFTAVLVSLVVLISASNILWSLKKQPKIKALQRFAWMQFALLALQITLGISNVKYALNLHSVSAHLSVGTLLLANSVWIFLWLRALRQAATPSTIRPESFPMPHTAKVVS